MTSSTGRDPGNFSIARLVRPVLLACSLAGAGIAAAPALADDFTLAGPMAGSALRAAMADRAPGDLKPFYAARGWKPLWLSADGHPAPAVETLLRQVTAARIDGLKPSKVKPAALIKAVEKARDGDPDDAAKIEIAASRLYAAWVQALRGAPRANMTYESEALAPVVPTVTSALESAARARSLDQHLATMGWMHPFYAPLRAALLDESRSDADRSRLALNLERVRALPAYPAERYVLVDAAGARLWMIEKGRPVDSMKVVVGKADNQTPMMAGFIRFATLNPYWNIPDDLVQQRIARNVLDRGTGYLKASGYQVLSSWDDDAALVDPATVDWQSVASGLRQVRVRQLPGGDNFMGKVKFEFPNPMGIYLHDTPSKDLMLKGDRQFSSGCVRLEDAARLGKWLMGKPLPRSVKGIEQRMNLPAPVPVYITYLTALPDPLGKTRAIAFQGDPYGRDGVDTRLATALR